MQAKNANETFTKTTEISVRPTGSLQKFAESGIVLKDKEKTFALPQNFVEGTYGSKIFVGSAPLMQFGHRLQTLLEYPHGCAEQTVSAVFPQLYFDELAGQINGGPEISESGNSELNPQVNINAAIQKLESMQLYNGAISYWPGQSDEYWWGTAYALHFLIEAEKTGFEVNPRVTKSMINFLTNRSNEEQTLTTLYLSVKNKNSTRDIVKPEFVYSLYVLSLTDQPNIAAMNLYKTEIGKLSNDQQFLLACAFKQIGDDKTYSEILPKTFAKENFERMLYGSFASPIKNMALTLNSLIETDPNNPQIALLSRSLNDVLASKTTYLNTQELGFSLMAMGKLYKKANSKGKAQIISDGKVIKTIEGKGEWIDLTKYPKGISLKITDDRMFYFWESEGIPKETKYIL